MMAKRAMVRVMAAWLGLVASGSVVLAQTAITPPAAPQTTTPNGGTAATPNESGTARGVVAPPRNVDPDMVTPPPANVKPNMPVITPPVSPR